MSLRTRDILNRRIEADCATQTQLEELLRHARLEHDQATAALADAQAWFSDRGAIVTRLEQQFATFSKSIAASRRLLLRSVMASMPEDVLRLVFQEIVDAPDERWILLGDGMFNKKRAQAPFVLAAVCKEWRRLSCDTCGLWTYFGIPSLANTPLWRATAHRDRVDLLVERSKAARVDILLNGSACEFGKERDQQLQHILTQLGEQSLRWRRVEICLPIQCDRRILSVLRGPTPHLEQLSLIAPSDSLWDQTPLLGFFPHAPRLRELEMSMTGIAPSPSTRLPSLRTLRLWHSARDEHVRALLDAAQPTLESLFLAAPTHTAHVPVTLSHLTSLTVYDRLFVEPSLLDVPRLSQLTIHSLAIQPEMATFLNDKAGTITDLTLIGAIKADALNTLRGLHKLKNLRVMVLFAYAAATSLDDDFWEQLADTEPPIWPRLSHINVDSGVELNPSDGHNITRLLRTRNGGGRRTIDVADSIDLEAAPVRLDEVTLDYTGVPHWVTAEVSRLLATPPHAI